MKQAPTVNSTQQASNSRNFDIQVSKRFEKMQAHSSSHRTAGTHEAPTSLPAAGILWQLRNEGGQR